MDKDRVLGIMTIVVVSIAIVIVIIGILDMLTDGFSKWEIF